MTSGAAPRTIGLMPESPAVSAPVTPGFDLAPPKILALSLGVTVGLWTLWFGLHLPGLEVGPKAAGPIVLVGWLGLSVIGARLTRPGLPGAAVAGFLTALVSLLALGSALVEQPDPSRFADGVAPLRPAAGLLAVGFLLTGGAVGALGCIISGRSSRTPSLPDPVADPWPCRMAIVVAASFLPLVLLGGLVTSTESGMAVHGWPDTFGANMFLYPISLMSQPRVFLEHSHRLFGTLAGLATLALWLVVVIGPGLRRRFGLWTTGLLLAVIVQGLVGGFRVVENNPYLGSLHGAFGQVVMAFAATLALWMSPRYRMLAPLPGIRTRPLRVIATAAFHTSILQLVLGSLFRHLRRDGNDGATHVLFTHIGLAFVVLTMAILAGAALSKFAREHRERLLPVAGRIRGIGVGIVVVIGLQFVLGWIALFPIMTSDARGAVPTADRLTEAVPVPLAEAVTATMHQFNGAIYLTLLMLGWAWARRLHKAARVSDG